ncbi:MAG: HU family DNA-binding protein [Ruminococcus sp.]|nr:HU family DNA-binding protein [Ruminococcus sp.]
MKYRKDLSHRQNIPSDTSDNGLASKDSVQLVGFGTFATVDKPEREGRNPATGESVEIAASTVVKLKAGAGLKEKVNKK